MVSRAATLPFSIIFKNSSPLSVHLLSLSPSLLSACHKHSYHSAEARADYFLVSQPGQLGTRWVSFSVCIPCFVIIIRTIYLRRLSSDWRLGLRDWSRPEVEGVGSEPGVGKDGHSSRAVTLGVSAKT